jgi:sarcosine oxidase subunit alpha
VSEEIRAKRLNSGIRRGEQVEFYFDGQPLKAFKGETIAAALMAAGHTVARTIDSQPLGVYCNIGVCHSCLMTVNGVKSVRTCRIPVTEGCKVETQHFERTK